MIILFTLETEYGIHKELLPIITQLDKKYFGIGTHVYVGLICIENDNLGFYKERKLRYNKKNKHWSFNVKVDYNSIVLSENKFTDIDNTFKSKINMYKDKNPKFRELIESEKFEIITS